ncbi:MAG: TetR/AcrR family transcriptional regulator [Solirubrobacteraceae bacterium]|nr:TetR/AcrR family transcriptional regulator [Solirubrobacteraceae bacterium]
MPDLPPPPDADRESRLYDEGMLPDDPATAGPRPMRADGRRNRERVLAAAREAFAEGGPDVGVAEIARRAGVGSATLFRHFATKDDLFAAAIEQMLDEMEETLVTGLAIEDPWDGLVFVMTSAAELQARDRLFLSAAGPELFGQERFETRSAKMFEQMGALLERAQTAGVVRDDLSAVDLPFVLAAIGGSTYKCGVATAPGNDPATDGLWRRYLGLVLDGLRPEAATPLTPPAPSMQQLTESKRRGA